jgi:hypothetical protein
MRPTNKDLSGNNATHVAHKEIQTLANDSEENRFLRQLGQFIRQFPWKSLIYTMAVVSVVASASWKTAIFFHRTPNPAESELAAARAAVRAAFPAHGLAIPQESNAVVLINILSNNLGPKIPVPETQNPATDISGHWRYTCTALDRKYSHGGEATIDTQMTPYGPQWRLSGIREWRETDGKREEKLNFHWSTDWAAFTDKNRIKYTYHIATERGEISGFADGAITELRNGIPTRIEGTFYQLPPLDPMYGNYELVKE